jgi:DNA-binding response OmpR family regulator
VLPLNKKKIILVVDDEPDITATYSMFLTIQGFEVITADNAIQALEIISTRVPDLIISDCMMPFMDGIEFAGRVKAHLATQNTPIILMSGAPELHDLTKSNYDVFLQKPVMFERLVPIIFQLLL